MNGRFRVTENLNSDQAKPDIRSGEMHTGSSGLQAEWMQWQDKRCSFAPIAEPERQPQPEPEGRKEWMEWYRNTQQSGRPKPAW